MPERKVNERPALICYTIATMEQMHTGLSALLAVLAIPALIGLFFAARFVYRQTVGRKMQTTLKQDYENEAAAFERSGKFVSAAQIWETKLKDLKRAAALYERGGDLKKAAGIYDFLGVSDRARELYAKIGSVDDAAEVSIREGEFEEAARLYGQAGKKIDEAVLMEKAGRRLPAIRAYREAGDFRNAARLLEAEGMIREAAEMFGLMLSDKSVDPSTIEDFHAFAIRLEQSGQQDKALEVYRRIDQADPTYRDVREKIQSLAPPPAEEPEPEGVEGMTSVRSFIRSGRMDPKYGFKLWFQVLRSLQDAHAAGRPFGLMSPENILIDAKNNIVLLKRSPSAAYIAPEQAKGLTLDVTADIFSMGVILYEMLTGSLDGLGSTRVLDLVSDVPDWLDEIVISCIRKVREDRYQSIDAIIADVRSLSRSKKEGE